MHDKLYKVRFLTDHLGKRFAEEFTPHQQVAVDECMIPFRGRLSFKQYHKDKPTKWGIKVWMLADSQTGYNYSFDVYTGKDADLDTMQNICKVSGVVLKLAKSLFGKGYTIFFDRFYTSPNLLYWLRRVDLSGCGTAMTNRRGFPKQLKSTGRSQQGEYDWLPEERHSGDALVRQERHLFPVKPRDRRSSTHNIVHLNTPFTIKYRI